MDLHLENSQKTLFKNKTRNSNEEITDCGLFIQENCETLPDKEESKVLSEIKTVHCQKDSPDKIDYRERLDVIEIDSDSDSSPEPKSLEKSEKNTIIQTVEKISDDEIEILRQFCCPLCKISYESTADIDNHMSKFHRIIDKSHRDSLVLKSKN